IGDPGRSVRLLRRKRFFRSRGDAVGPFYVTVQPRSQGTVTQTSCSALFADPFFVCAYTDKTRLRCQQYRQNPKEVRRWPSNSSSKSRMPARTPRRSPAATKLAAAETATDKRF